MYGLFGLLNANTGSSILEIFLFCFSSQETSNNQSYCHLRFRTEEISKTTTPI